MGIAYRNGTDAFTIVHLCLAYHQILVMTTVVTLFGYMLPMASQVLSKELDSVLGDLTLQCNVRP
jgi:hypothetical protein